MSRCIMQLHGLTIIGEYMPEEKMTDDYPGCPEELEIVAILSPSGDNITDSIEWLSTLTNRTNRTPVNLWSDITAECILQLKEGKQ